MQQSIIGKIIDNYEITGILGKGGMGVVYKAKDMTLDRTVALKMMDDNFARDEEFLKRFKAEAKALAKLQNPNIVSVFALRETDIGLALVMEFVDGNTLADRIHDQGALPLSTALPIFKQLLIALGDAHKNNVIHRDIKPSNVMITSDNIVKVTDFGLAKIQQITNATVTIGTGGTLYYMSPEQIRGLSNVDARGDIYSLGVTLYETITGRVPFEPETSDFDIRQAIVEGKIPSPDKFVPGLPKELVAIVMKSIHRDPARRFQSCPEMLDAMSHVHIKQRSDDERPGESGPQIDGSKPVTSLGARIYIPLGLIALFVAGYFFVQQFRGTSAKLSIVSNPAGSNVSVDGKEVGFTPINEYIVRNESAKVRVAHDGYAMKDTIVSLRKGQKFILTLDLMKLPEEVASHPEEKKSPASTIRPKPALPADMGTLRLRAEPLGAVSVDGGPLSNSANEFQVKAGERHLLFNSPKYGQQRTTVNIRPGETKQVTCYFETYVSIVTSGAPWALVVLDGKTTDVQTPIDGLPLGPGRHRISVTRIGFETVGGEKIVNAAPSFQRKTERLTFTLRQK